MTFADNAASGVCLAPSCFFLVFSATGFLGEDFEGDSELESEDSDEVAEEASEAADMEAEGFLESPLMVAEESEEGACTSAGGCPLVLARTADFADGTWAGASKLESESDAEAEADSLLSDTGAGLTVGFGA